MLRWHKDVLCHAVLCRAVPCCAMPCHAAWFSLCWGRFAQGSQCHAIACCAVPCHFRYAGGCQVPVPCHVTPSRRAVPCAGGAVGQRGGGTHAMYCSVLLNFLARYLAEALLGIFTMESSLP